MTDVPRKRPSGLGRGLSSLLGEVAHEAPVSGDSGRAGVQLLPVASIEPNPHQPRRHFSEDSLVELAQSIAERGLLQPLVVRPNGHRFQIVAGERRWRAAQRAHLHEVPVLVRELTDGETLELALIENIQRQDLNAIEEAESYRRLIAEYGHTQDELGRAVSKSRSHVSNLLRLLDLPENIRNHLASGEISMGHARALIGVPGAEALADQIIRQGLSVREAERLAGEGKARKPRSKGSAQVPNADIEALQRQLSDLLGLKVTIGHQGAGGTVALHYSSLDQLDMICQRLSGERI